MDPLKFFTKADSKSGVFLRLRPFPKSKLFWVQLGKVCSTTPKDSTPDLQRLYTHISAADNLPYFWYSININQYHIGPILLWLCLVTGPQTKRRIKAMQFAAASGSQLSIRGADQGFGCGRSIPQIPNYLHICSTAPFIFILNFFISNFSPPLSAYMLN